PIPRRRTRGRRKARKPKAPKVTPAIVIEDRSDETVLEGAPADTGVRPAEVPDGEHADARRYVAVVSEIEGAEPFPAQETRLFPTTREYAQADTYPTDIPIGLAAALLAGSVFFRWYVGQPGFPVFVTGWRRGTLAPLILFL